jgi:hypothetical protein
MKINADNLIKLDFELNYDYKDSEIEYQDYQFKDLTVCIEPKKIIVELKIDKSSFEFNGVKTIEDVEKLINLIYGE